MNNWTIFSDLFSLIGPQLTDMVDSMIGGLATWVRPILQYGIIFYLGARMLEKAATGADNPLSDMELMLIKGGLALYIAANVAGYNEYIRDLIMNDLPKELSAKISGGSGQSMLNGQVFDEAWGKAYKAGLEVYKNIGSWWDAKAYGLAFVVVLYWFAAIAGIGFAFSIWVKAFVYLAILIGTGPIFAGLFFFPPLRGLFDRWFGLLLSKVLLQFFAVVLLTVLISAETQTIGKISTSAATTTGMANEFAQIGMLFGGVVLFAVCGWIAHEMSALSATIGGGFATDVTAAARWSYSALSGREGSSGSSGGGRSNTEAAPAPAREESEQQVARNSPPARSMSD